MPEPTVTQPLRGEGVEIAIKEAEEVDCCADCCNQSAGGCDLIGGLCSVFQCCFVCCELAK